MFPLDFVHHLWLRVATASLICVSSGLVLLNLYKRQQMRRKMSVRASKSKENIQRLKDELAQLQIHDEIILLSFQELQAKLQKGDLKAVDVLRAYQAKALIVNERVNAITDIIPSAMSIAAHLDTLSAAERGPLHGIPISLKESCGLKGQDCTAGFGEMIGKSNSEDALLVKVLKAKGAVPFIRTNLPQGMRSIHSINPIYGETCHPNDLTRSSGGSSGGEGSIIGGQGSILGVGSDIGGSIRIPAHFCGICALKPTAARMSYTGNFSTEDVGGQNIIFPTDGPMGKDVSSLVAFMQAVFSPELFRLDPSLPPIPFREEIYQSKGPLRIGYYVYDGCTRCVPAVERAVLSAKQCLENMGHTLVETEPHKPFYALTELLLSSLLGDDLDSYANLLKYDTDGIVFEAYKFHQKPYYIRCLLAQITQLIIDDPLTINLMKRKPLRSVKAYFKKSIETNIFRKEFAAKWKSEKLDLIICPCMPSPATKCDITAKLLGGVAYTALYNVVDYPVGVLPVTKVTATDVAQTMKPEVYNAKNWLERKLREECGDSEGLSVGIQVVAQPFMEELVLRVMSELEAAL